MSEYDHNQELMRNSLASANMGGMGGASLAAPGYQLGGMHNGPGDPPGGGLNVGIGLSFKLGGRKDSGWKIKVFAEHTSQLSNFLDARVGLGAAYHSNFYGTGRSGMEFRQSAGLDYHNGDFSATLATNNFMGTGQLQEFDQRTGFMNLQYKDVGFSYENDGTPFQKIGLGDGDDKFRTAAASIQVGEFDLDMNLFTGRRDQKSFDWEKDQPGGEKGISQGRGEFGEFYANGFVKEHKSWSGEPYRMGNLTLNHQGMAFGLDSEWIRHGFQNIVAHKWISSQRQFPMLSGDWTPVFESYSAPRSRFTLWDR